MKTTTSIPFFLSLLVGALQPLITLSCPSQCSCVNHVGNKVSVICSTTDLVTLPHSFDPHTNLFTIMGPRNSPFSMTHISRNDIKSLTSLEHLTISFTHLASIEEDSFLDLVHLKRIDLANNKLSEILPNTFTSLRNLTFISLSNNPALVISDRSFWNLENLQELYLSGVGITQLRPAMFYGLKNLRQLDVSSNHLTSFSPDILLQMPQLWSLDLAFNDLMSLDSLLEPFFVRLKRVQLGGNRWQCNCLLRWLKSYPQFFADRTSDSVTCSAPAGLEYVALAEIETNQLTCDPPAIRNCPSTVTVLEGESLIIRCLVTGDPYPSITWTFSDGTRLMSSTYPGMAIKDRAAIQIQSVPMSHTGNLTLTAINGIGTETATINVIVTRPTTPTTTTVRTSSSTYTPSTTKTTTTITTTTPLSTTTETISSTPTTINSTVPYTTTTAATTTPPLTTTTTTTTTRKSSVTTSSPTLKVSTPRPKSTTKHTPAPTKQQPRIYPTTKNVKVNTNNKNNNNNNNNNDKQESKSDIDIVPIIIASVASTAALMLGAGILVYFMKKWNKPKHPFKSKVAPHTPDSFVEEQGTSKEKDLTDHVLRMQKFDAPTRPHTLY